MKKFKSFVEKFNIILPHIFFWLFIYDILMSFIKLSNGNSGKWLEYSIAGLMSYFFYMNFSKPRVIQNITINNKSMDTDEVIQSICKGLEQSMKNAKGL